jgi:hypothetical protein
MKRPTGVYPSASNVLSASSNVSSPDEEVGVESPGVLPKGRWEMLGTFSARSMAIVLVAVTREGPDVSFPRRLRLSKPFNICGEFVILHSLYSTSTKHTCHCANIPRF